MSKLDRLDRMNRVLVVIAILLTFLLLPFFLIFEHLIIPAYLRIQNRV